MVEQITETNEINLTEKFKQYKNKSLPSVSVFNSSPLESVMKNVYKTNSKLDDVCNRIISENTPFKVKVIRGIQTLLSYTKLGQKPTEIEVSDVFDTYFDEVSGISMELRDYTAEAQSKASSLENQLMDLYDQMKELYGGFSQTFGDAEEIDKSIVILENKGITTKPKPGYEQESKELLQLNIYFDNAKSKAKMAKQNYVMRDQAVGLVEFYKDIIKEFAETGEQAFNDIDFIVAQLKPLVTIIDDTELFGKRLERANELVSKVGNYMGEMTKIIGGYMGVIGKARINDGKIIPYDVRETLRREADNLTEKRKELRKQDLKEIKQGIMYESTK